MIGVAKARFQRLNPAQTCSDVVSTMTVAEDVARRECLDSEKNRKAGLFFGSLFWWIYLPMSVGQELESA